MPKNRRHAAIMFTDIVGYTALMGSDEDRAFEVLARNREIHTKLIKQFNGTLIKEMGDGMLTSFDLASEAVRCAIEIQKAAKSHDIPLKIGIHEGEMVFEGNDVLGDGVNIASRIQDHTDRGCIMISGSVYRDIKNKADIQTEFVEEKRFKNVDEKISIYRVNCHAENISHQSNRVTNNKKKRKFLFIAIGFFTVIILIAFYWRAERSDQAKQRNVPYIQNNEKWIAVLPFRNIGSDQASAGLADGVMEAIISHLSNIGQLKVISRTSSEVYRATIKTSSQIAEELKVHFLLEGSAQKHENQFRINVKLINAVEDYNVWNMSYDKEMKDIFKTQSDIAADVANAMQIQLSKEENNQIMQSPTTIFESNDLYVKGRYYWNKRTEKDLLYSLELFKKSIELDSENALAWSGLADSYLMLSGYGHFSFSESNTNAKLAIKKALAINPNLAEAYTTLGWVYAFDNHDWKKSQESFEIALRYKPSYSVAHSWYAWTLVVNGKTKLSESHIQTARSLDPLSDIINASTGWVTYINGNFAEAKKHFNSAISLNAEFPRYYFWLGHTFMASEQYDSAIYYLQKSLELENESPQYLSNLIFCQGRAQNSSETKILYRRLLDLADKRFISNYDLALAQLGIGDVEGAIDFLMKAYDDRDIWITFLAVDPRFNYLHERQDFQKIIKKMGINTSWMQ